MAIIFSRTQAVSAEQTFSDVTPDMWSYNHIEGVKEFLTGYYPAGAQPFFNPQGKAMREDIAYSLVKITGLDKDYLGDTAIFDRFADSDDISPSIKEFVGIAMEKGLIRGYEDSAFRPNQGITRAEAVALLFRALKAPVTVSP
ncbi:MAG: S-layer homology domain-containing protein [Firmicutes bacterium]|nr:S-layer homology domain-containing protein [Bacillota bacterium]